jgi:heme/copper-type cytochrome/quinol oxidase subunit 2
MPAPADVAAGRAAFEAKCASCHTIGGGDRIGPDLAGVAATRDSAWLERWIREPDVMIAEGDATARDLLAKYQQIPMPNLGIGAEEAKSLIAYMAAAPAPAPAVVAGDAPAPVRERGPLQSAAFVIFLATSAVIVAVFLWVVRTTAAPREIDLQVAYKLRRVLLAGGGAVVALVLLTTLPWVPYVRGEDTPEHLVHVLTRQFGFVFTAEPVASAEDLARVPVLNDLELPAGAPVEFRVTTLDVTHSFAIYGPDGSVHAQTQAMPGYTNRLRVRFDRPGEYAVLCLEYCGLAHHLMRTSFTVR